MKLYALLAMMLFFHSCVNAQTADTSRHKISVKVQAEKMGSLLLKKEFDEYTKFAYPKLVEMLGGKQKLIALLENGTKEMAAGGSYFSNIIIGEPSEIIFIGNEMQCTVPQTIEMKVTNGRLITISTLIAISDDKGKNWYFLDTTNSGINELVKVFPNLSAKLIIPKTNKPVFYGD